jgi:hypothetical protein
MVRRYVYYHIGTNKFSCLLTNPLVLAFPFPPLAGL